jgi:alpha-ketoglutarate-dependent 2,4-dichlorophenoxyacetate dioxygenase
MSVSIRQIHPVFAGEVTGVDCRAPLSPATVAAVEAGMDQYAVLVFRDQTSHGPAAAGLHPPLRRTRGLPTPGHIRKHADSRLAAGMADFSNLDKSGNIMSDQDRVWFFKLGDRLWHSDSSFRPVPAKYSLLSGRVIPSWGANTDFADMRAAYDALDERTKAEVEDLVCEHSLMFSREAIGFTDLTPEEREAFRPIRQRLVRTHPVTGRKSLFLSAHAGTIWAGRSPRLACSCASSPSSRPTNGSSIRMSGASTTW